MIHHYERALLTTGAAAGAAYAQLLHAGRTVHLRAVSVLVNAASADTSIGLVRAATNGTAGASSTAAVGSRDAPAAGATIKTAWSAAPTIAATPLWHRRTVIKSGSSGEFAWSWEHGEFVLSPDTPESLLLWNFGAVTGNAVELWLGWEEET